MLAESTVNIVKRALVPRIFYCNGWRSFTYTHGTPRVMRGESNECQFKSIVRWCYIFFSIRLWVESWGEVKLNICEYACGCLWMPMDACVWNGPYIRGQCDNITFWMFQRHTQTQDTSAPHMQLFTWCLCKRAINLICQSIPEEWSAEDCKVKCSPIVKITRRNVGLMFGCSGVVGGMGGGAKNRGGRLSYYHLSW